MSWYRTLKLTMQSNLSRINAFAEFLLNEGPKERRYRNDFDLWNVNLIRSSMIG